MQTAGLIFAALAAAVHVLIFYMESIAWEGQLARKIFGGTPQEARPHAFYAFNQGFYNLFLTLQTVVGIVLVVAGAVPVGSALVLAGAGSMLAAAAVLAVYSSSHCVAAAKQGSFPLLAVVCTVVALIS